MCKWKYVRAHERESGLYHDGTVKPMPGWDKHQCAVGTCRKITILRWNKWTRFNVVIAPYLIFTTLGPDLLNVPCIMYFSYWWIPVFQVIVAVSIFRVTLKGLCRVIIKVGCNEGLLDRVRKYDRVQASGSGAQEIWGKKFLTKGHNISVTEDVATLFHFTLSVDVGKWESSKAAKYRCRVCRSCMMHRLNNLSCCQWHFFQ